MGVRLVAKDVDAEAFATEYAAQVRRALQDVSFTNTSLAKAVRNYAPGKVSGSSAGSPVVAADRTTFNGLVNYLQTQVSETESMTFFIVARSGDANTSAATRPAFFGNYAGLAADGGAADGIILFFSAAGSISVNAGYGNTAADKTFPRASLSSANAGNWALYVVVVSPTGINFRDVTNARTTTQTGTGGLPRRLCLNKFRIGSAFQDYSGSCDVAAVQIHSAALTEEEIALTIADLRGYVSRKGITV